MVRIYDIIATNPGRELSDALRIGEVDAEKFLYNPSNLGGGYVRDEAGNLAPANTTIQFDVIFKTDAESTGHQKYNKTLQDLSERKIVWLRYGVPDGDSYIYAYRPGYISEITKTEARYQNGGLVEKVTVSTVGGWFYLYEFSDLSTDSTSSRFTIKPGYAKKNPKHQVFSNYPDNWKAIPIQFPYYYKKIVEEIQKGTWHTRWGNVLDESSDVYQIFAIHAPSVYVSELEDLALSEPENALQMQINRTKAPDFASKSTNEDDKIERLTKERGLRGGLDAIRQRRQLQRTGKPMTFKLPLENYSINVTSPMSENGPNSGSYDSYLILGKSTKENSAIRFTSSTGVVASQLKFEKTGDIVIDTGSWANIYLLGGSSADINFANFFKTTANQNEVITTEGVKITRLVMRRGVLGV